MSLKWIHANLFLAKLFRIKMKLEYDFYIRKVTDYLNLNSYKAHYAICLTSSSLH